MHNIYTKRPIFCDTVGLKFLTTYAFNYRVMTTTLMEGKIIKRLLEFPNIQKTKKLTIPYHLKVCQTNYIKRSERNRK